MEAGDILLGALRRFLQCLSWAGRCPQARSPRTVLPSLPCCPPSLRVHIWPADAGAGTKLSSIPGLGTHQPPRWGNAPHTPVQPAPDPRGREQWFPPPHTQWGARHGTPSLGMPGTVPQPVSPVPVTQGPAQNWPGHLDNCFPNAAATSPYLEEFLSLRVRFVLVLTKRVSMQLSVAC